MLKRKGEEVKVALEYTTVNGVALTVAYFFNHAGRFALGKTSSEALGALVQTYPDAFGVHIEWNLREG